MSIAAWERPNINLEEEESMCVWSAERTTLRVRCNGSKRTIAHKPHPSHAHRFVRVHRQDLSGKLHTDRTAAQYEVPAYESAAPDGPKRGFC